MNWPKVISHGRKLFVHWRERVWGTCGNLTTYMGQRQRIYSILMMELVRAGHMLYPPWMGWAREMVCLFQKFKGKYITSSGKHHSDQEKSSMQLGSKILHRGVSIMPKKEILCWAYLQGRQKVLYSWPCKVEWLAVGPLTVLRTLTFFLSE